MARIDDIPEPTRTAILALDVPAATTHPFYDASVTGYTGHFRGFGVVGLRCGRRAKRGG